LLSAANFIASPYIIHVSKIIIGHLNSGSNKTVSRAPQQPIAHYSHSRVIAHYSNSRVVVLQGVENQDHISSTNAAINAALSAGKPFGPSIPWRPVDYFQHLNIPSAEILSCSVIGDTSADRRCVQKVMNSWNARFGFATLNVFIAR
jgi:hypothetical protein